MFYFFVVCTQYLTKNTSTPPHCHINSFLFYYHIFIIEFDLHLNFYILNLFLTKEKNSISLEVYLYSAFGKESNLTKGNERNKCMLSQIIKNIRWKQLNLHPNQVATVYEYSAVIKSDFIITAQYS